MLQEIETVMQIFAKNSKNKHDLRYSRSVTDAHLIGTSYANRNHGEQCDDREPKLQAQVVEVLLPVIQREDDHGGEEE